MNAVELKDGPDGVTLKVKAKPKARWDAVLGVRGDALVVSVRATPERGRANRALVAVLARELRVPRSQVEIVAGRTHSEKVVRLAGLTAREVRARLEL